MKPEKKVVEQLQSIHMGYTQGERIADARGYNKCWDDREKWLPNKKEIEEMFAECASVSEAVIKINKRLRGEK